MKSRTSYFNGAIFRKNLTRFAPAWALYTIFLLLVLFLISPGDSIMMPYEMGYLTTIMALFTAGFALVAAQLLFGDLYSSRMCNALHALPVRRESWFLTNVLSGLVFHLIPTAVMTLASTAFMLEADAWYVGLYWFLGVNLQYLCFFGIAVFSAFCVGSRFAMVTVYGILNFASLIVGWMADTLFMSMLDGLVMDYEPFYWFSPLVEMLSGSFVDVERVREGGYVVGNTVTLGESFGLYFAYAAAGLALMAGALGMYRRRALERAGEFIAPKVLEPIFLVVYSLIMGACFAFVAEEIFGYGDGVKLVFLFMGLVIGCFTGRMLLKRTIRVFQPRGWAFCGAMALVMGLALTLTALDPLGVVTWMPQAENVDSVTVGLGYGLNFYGAQVTLDDQEEIAEIIGIHSRAVAGLQTEGVIEATEGAEVITADASSDESAVETVSHWWSSANITIVYHMESGRDVVRNYRIVTMNGTETADGAETYTPTEDGEILNRYLSSVAGVFGEDATAEELAARYTALGVQSWYGDEIIYLTNQEDILGLMEAIVADCEAGHMGSSHYYFSEGDSIGDIFRMEDYSTVVGIYDDSANVIAWLTENYPEFDLPEEE